MSEREPATKAEVEAFLSELIAYLGPRTREGSRLILFYFTGDNHVDVAQLGPEDMIPLELVYEVRDFLNDHFSPLPSAAEKAEIDAAVETFISSLFGKPPLNG